MKYYLSVAIIVILIAVSAVVLVSLIKDTPPLNGIDTTTVSNTAYSSDEGVQTPSEDVNTVTPNEDTTAPIESSTEGQTSSPVSEDVSTETDAVTSTVTTAVVTTSPETTTGKTEETAPDIVTQPTETYPPVDPTPTGAYIANGIVISGTRAMEQFGGTAKSGIACAEYLNTFKSRVGDSVNVFAMPIPTASGIYAPAEYPKSLQRTEDCFIGLRDSLDGVIYVDTLTTLRAHADEYIYLRTDHHWAALGAYYAAQQLADAAGLPFTELDGFVQDEVGTFTGSMYRYSQDEILKRYPDTLICYVPMQEYTCDYYTRDNFKFKFSGTLFSTAKSYTRFTYGDSYIAHIKTGVQNGRKLIVFKESYGNALSPFLISSFEEVYIVDMRYFELNALQFIAEKGITDVCFPMCSFTVAGGNRKFITSITEQ